MSEFPKYYCPRGCKKPLFSRVQLKLHVEKQHAKCEFCDQVFLERGIRNHIHQAHPGQVSASNYFTECEFCHKFVSLTNLARHVSTKHRAKLEARQREADLHKLSWTVIDAVIRQELARMKRYPIDPAWCDEDGLIELYRIPQPLRAELRQRTIKTIQRVYITASSLVAPAK